MHWHPKGYAMLSEEIEHHWIWISSGGPETSSQQKLKCSLTFFSLTLINIQVFIDIFQEFYYCYHIHIHKYVYIHKICIIYIHKTKWKSWISESLTHWSITSMTKVLVHQKNWMNITTKDKCTVQVKSCEQH